jgi:hypothetical protein
VGEQSFFKFTLLSKDRLYVTLESVLFRDASDPRRFAEGLGGKLPRIHGMSLSFWPVSTAASEPCYND